MIHLKIQHEMDATKKPKPEIARMLQEKQVSEQRRLEQIRMQLGTLLSGGA
jgi:hypothetical protein